MVLNAIETEISHGKGKPAISGRVGKNALAALNRMFRPRASSNAARLDARPHEARRHLTPLNP